MFSLSKQKTIVGLDIEAGSVAATEIRFNGQADLAGYGTLPLAPGIFREGEVSDPAGLADALKELFAEHKLSKNVRLGIANQRVAVRTIHLPALDDPAELEAAIRFQAQEHIPMPLDQAVLDWHVLGAHTSESGHQTVEVVVVAGRRDMLGGAVEALRAAGLRTVGIDHSAFGMIRALTSSSRVPVGAGEYVEAPLPQQPADAPAVGAKLYCNLGDVTNLAVARGPDCLFARMAAFGIEGIAQKIAERKSLTLEHARQWLHHVGLTDPLESVEGDPEIMKTVREALTEGAAKLGDELRMSLEFYRQQEGALQIDGVVACGAGTAIPGLVERVAVELGQPFEIGRPAALSRLGEAAASRLTLSYGLALEE